MSLSAAQLIYTNVEKKLSSNGREGFQVWLRTPAVLSDGEVAEVQTRLADYEERRDATTKDESAVRHSFFSLSTDRIVIARTVPLTETDQFRRGGRFYAHAIILDCDDFRTLNNDPFAVIDQMRFHSSLEEGKSQGDAARGTIPIAILEERPAERCPPAVTAECLTQTIPVLMRTFDPERPIIFAATAPPSRVLALIRQMFDWLPVSLRSECSFDTLSNGRSLTPVPYCVAGLPAAGAPRRYLNLVLFDFGKQAFAPPLKPSAEGTFGRWLQKPLISGVPPESTRAEAAFKLGAALDSGRVEPEHLIHVDPALFEEIAYAHDAIPKLDAILNARLTADVGEVLAPLILSHATHWLHEGGLGAFRDLAEPLPAPLLLGWLLAIYEQRPRDAVQKFEIAALKDVLERTKHADAGGGPAWRHMILIFYRWARKWDQIAKWAADTQLISDELFEWFVRWSLGTLPIRVERGSGPAQRGVWCGPHLTCEDDVDDDECQKLVGAILGQGAEGEPGLPPDRWSWALYELLTRAK